jgi:arsenical pump membrane protein
VTLAWTAAVLVAVLAFAIVRPRGLPEVTVAVPAAVLVILVGPLQPSDALAELKSIGPTIGFLAAVLILGHLCEAEGVFGWVAAVCGSVSHGSPRRLLLATFALASVTTAVLSLDATVVLLTPVLLTTTSRLRLSARPHVYACTHLANSASLLLPVSNLTNLLVFGATGLTFLGFAGLMVGPWLLCILIEFVVFRWFFAADLAGRGEPDPQPIPPAPVFALVVLAGTLVGFMVIEPVWAASAGVLVLGTHAFVRRLVGVGGVVQAAGLPFLVFVVALGLVVTAVQRAGLQDVLTAIVPVGHALPELLAMAGTAAVLANLVNNLPAVLLLMPVAAVGGPGALLALLIGANVGPNLTYLGSLATLLWRRVLIHRDAEPSLWDFTKLGLATVPACLAGATVALWAGLTLFGG